MKFLLDTMVISELRKHKPHGGLLSWYASHPQSDYAISAVTLYEMQAGAETTRRQDPRKAREIEQWVDEIADVCPVIPLGIYEAREAARLLVGIPAELLEDAMIAATARIHHLTVSTRNTKHFQLLRVSMVDPFTPKSLRPRN